MTGFEVKNSKIGTNLFPKVHSEKAATAGQYAR